MIGDKDRGHPEAEPAPGGSLNFTLRPAPPVAPAPLVFLSSPPAPAPRQEPSGIEARSLDPSQVPFLRPAAGRPGLMPADDVRHLLAEADPPRRRGRGRPGWTPALFRRRWAQAIARGKLSEPVKYREVAGHFESLDDPTIGVIDPEYLGTLARKYLPEE